MTFPTAIFVAIVLFAPESALLAKLRVADETILVGRIMLTSNGNRSGTRLYFFDRNIS
jgi:hypothetical protein